MRVPIAWRNLTARPVATAVKLVAITFAIVLIFLQIALYELCLVSAVQQFDMFDFDLIVTSSGYIDMAQPSDFPRSRLALALSDPAAERATPVGIGTTQWRNPDTGLRYPVLAIGVPPTADVFVQPQLRREQWRLAQLGGVLFDEKTLPIYGPRYAGLTTAAGDESVNVVGLYANGAGFSGGGALVAGDATFGEITPGDEPGRVNLGMLKLKPGFDPAAVAARLRASLPPDVRVRTREELYDEERSFFVNRKPVGIMFSSGVVIGFLIAAVIFHQVLATEILKRQREYATMKAVGYSDRAVSRAVVEQAALYALFSFVPALMLATGLYGLLREAAAVNLSMTVTKAGFVGGMALLMCGASGLLGVRKTRTADPAELF